MALTACGSSDSTQTTMETVSQTSEALTTQAAASSTESATTVSSTEADANQLLNDVKGTYDELFTVICDPEYDQIWIDKCSAIIGDEQASEAAQMLKSACTGTIYGDEAITAYTSAENSENVQFDCYFINGVKQFTFDGNKFSGVDEKGETVFEHEYKFTEEFSLGGMMDGYLYETDDADAGEFKYFFFAPDTPDSTYHIEFRYGDDKDALQGYNEGKYAYWLAAVILENADEAMIDDVIGLFVEENLGSDESAAESAD